jgi:hypothetical protein
LLNDWNAFFNTIALFFAWKASLNKKYNGLAYSIITIFIFLAIRYDFGNEYMSYFMNFYEINEYDNFSIKVDEIGWIYLNYIFKPFGFISMQIFLAGFSCYISVSYFFKFDPSLSLIDNLTKMYRHKIKTI